MTSEEYNFFTLNTRTPSRLVEDSVCHKKGGVSIFQSVKRDKKYLLVIWLNRKVTSFHEKLISFLKGHVQNP